MTSGDAATAPGHGAREVAPTIRPGHTTALASLTLWANTPRRDRVAGSAVVLALMLLIGLRPLWQATDPELDAIISYHERGSRTDPWGRPFLRYEWERLATRHSFTYSAGPDGVDDTSASCREAERTMEWLDLDPSGWIRGDDFLVAYGHPLTYGPARKLDLLWWWSRVIPIGALVLALPSLAVRQARTPRSPRLTVELVRAAFVAAPLAALTGLGLMALEVAAPAWSQPVTLVSWPVSVAASVELLLTVAVLGWRTGARPPSLRGSTAVTERLERTQGR